MAGSPRKLTSKADAGAQYIQLQLCFDLGVLRDYAARIVSSKLTWRLQILAGLAVLPSADAARELRMARPDSIIPSSIVKRIEQADDQEAEGIAIAAEQLQRDRRYTRIVRRYAGHTWRAGVYRGRNPRIRD